VILAQPAAGGLASPWCPESYVHEGQVLYRPLARTLARRHAVPVYERQRIYREEVLVIMGALADIDVNVRQILGYLEGDDEAEAEEDLPDA